MNKLLNLPRDSRDTLFLLIVIAWVILPQTQHLPLWCSALAAGVLAWRAWLAWMQRPLPGKALLMLSLALTVGATLVTHKSLLGRDAGVTIIVVLLTLKTLELRARRDAFVVFFLGFFTMLTNFFYSQSLLTAAAMVVAMLGLLTALVNSHMPVGRPPLWRSLRIAGSMTLLGAPLMVMLFVFFPRLAPLWGAPGDAMSGRSGLSGSMQVGTIASLALDDSVAMRVVFEGPSPQQPELYFRGPVLSTFDGREWQALRSGFTQQRQLQANLQVRGPAFSYQITQEPNNRPWLLVLDGTLEKPDLPPGLSTFMTPELQWVTNRPITDLLRYKASSHMQYSHGPERPEVALQDYLELPPGFNPRTLQLAVDIRRDPRYAQAGALPLVEAVMQRLREGGYTYTLEPGVFGKDTADEFWFDRKAGFCEHIASSFVILMRSLDIPARIVTGYQGGQLNQVGNFWIIRQSDAHAWAEVWVENQGWTRVDPTSAVSPGRIGSLLRLQAPQGVLATAIGTVSPVLALNVRELWDAMNNRWNQWILNYTQSKQLNLLRQLGFASPSWEDLGYMLAGCLVLVSLLGAGWTLLERNRQDPWIRLLHSVHQRLLKAGFELPAQAPPRAIAKQLMVDSEHHPERQALSRWLLKLEAWRYAPADSHAKVTLAQLRRELQKIRWPS